MTATQQPTEVKAYSEDNVNEILGPAVLKSGLRPDQQSEIDKLLIAEDGTSDKSKLGANAILGISMAVARAGASVKVCCLLSFHFIASGPEDYDFLG